MRFALSRQLRLALALAMAASLLVALPTPASAHPDACGGKTSGVAAAVGAAARVLNVVNIFGDFLPTENAAPESRAEAECFTEAEIANFDDSAARDELRRKRIALKHNLPKTGTFAPESAFGSDLAFADDYAIYGNYNGFSIADISNPNRSRRVAQVDCPGSQNDVSVYKNFIITSTDSSRNKAECEGNEPQSATIKESWEGIRVFDWSDPENPEYVTGVETDCGSHTHSIITQPRLRRILVYVSSYFPDASFPDCQPPHDKISIVEIPMDSPEDSRVVAEPVLFPDGGFPGDDYTRETSGCHDITIYQRYDIAAGACMGEGIMMDITNPLDPEVLWSVTDPNFAFWHSATFNNDATSVVFTDELGGGGGPTCNPTIGDEKGANAIYDVSNIREPEFASYFKIPRTQSNTENCVAHNGSLIPHPTRDLMVQAWYQGGTSVIDFTNPSRPRELAFYDRPQLSDERLILGGSWSSYWYKNRAYSSDIQMGLDTFAVQVPAARQANKYDWSDEVNVQAQTRFDK